MHLQPTIDEVTVGRERSSRGENERRIARPAIRKHTVDIVTNAEAELGHDLHVRGAPVVGSIGAGSVGVVERLLVDAVGEVDQRLQVRAASGRRERGGNLVCRRIIVLAKPFDLGIGIHGVFGLGRCLAGQHFHVLGNGHFGGGVSQVVVGRETADRHGVVAITVIGGVEKSWNPCML